MSDFETATITVVIPTFNRDGIVQRAIDSALAQTRPADEIIVVDDGSSDGTRDALLKYGDSIRYIWQPNAGVSTARNTGILAAKGRWIAFLDSDDEWVPSKLFVQMQHLTTRNDLVAMASNSSVIHPGKATINMFDLRGTPEVDHEGILLRPLQSVLRGRFFTPTVIARRDQLIKVGLFDTHMSMCEDLDVMARLALQGPWGVAADDLVHVLRQGNPKESLTHQEIDRPLYVAQCRLHLYNKIVSQSGLTPDEMRFVRKQLAASRLSMAAVHLRTGNRRDGNRCIVRVMRDDPSLKTLVKALLSLSFGSAGIRLVKTIECRGNAEFWR